MKRTGPQSLGPLAVGSHGETVVRFLRPGFHSGTVAEAFRAGPAGEAGRQRTGSAQAPRGVAPRRGGSPHGSSSAMFAALLRESRSLHDVVDRARIDPPRHEPHPDRASGRRSRPAQPLDRPGGTLGRPIGQDLASRMARGKDLDDESRRAVGVALPWPVCTNCAVSNESSPQALSQRGPGPTHRSSDRTRRLQPGSISPMSRYRGRHGSPNGKGCRSGVGVPKSYWKAVALPASIRAPGLAITS